MRRRDRELVELWRDKKPILLFHIFFFFFFVSYFLDDHIARGSVCHKVSSKDWNTKGNKNGCCLQGKISRARVQVTHRGNWMRVGLNGLGYSATEVGKAIRDGFKMYHWPTSWWLYENVSFYKLTSCFSEPEHRIFEWEGTLEVIL